MDDPERHTNVRFEEELTTLRATLLKMGGLVEHQIADAVEWLVKRNSAQARETIARDVEVNAMDVEIDERCIRLLALYQPAASDLRLITTGLKITTDLERIGDNAVNICERTLGLNQEPPLKPYVDIPRMAEIARSMVKDSLEAFTRSDVALADAVIARDDEVDKIDRQIYQELPRYMAQDPKAIPRATGILFVSKFLERIADHATNIAEMVVFLVKGHTIRHTDIRRRHVEHP
jgi:phosphate transport system protein